MAPSGRALVVDDDDDVRELLTYVLREMGLDVRSAGSGLDGLEMARSFEPDLVTLDLGLPDVDGVEVCRRLRVFTDAYVVMITGRDDESDRLIGLDVGADDYLSKPVSPREVRARAAALLRRPRVGSGAVSAATSSEAPAPPAADPVIDAGGGLVLVPVRHVAMLDGEALPLTPAEVDLLAVLSGSPGRRWGRAELAREVWRGEFTESDFLVDVHVASLRRKLRKAGARREWISTVDGSGYRFDRLSG